MNLDKMQKTMDWLKDASKEDIQKMADDIAENAPYLCAGNIDMSDKEKAVMFVKMQIYTLANTDFSYDSMTTFEHTLGYVQGLIAGCAMSKLITEQEEDDLNKTVSDERNKFYKTD